MCAACFAHGLETQQERIGGSRTAQQLKTFNRGCTQMDEDSPRCNVAELFAFICVHLWFKNSFTVFSVAGNAEYRVLALLWDIIHEN